MKIDTHRFGADAEPTIAVLKDGNNHLIEVHEKEGSFADILIICDDRIGLNIHYVLDLETMKLIEQEKPFQQISTLKDRFP